ncbi:RING-H2 zinc finger domain-containing protein 2 [Elsinoe fawcettii]|nr:RING-H2 zinc finger domain-containing protein 2 [Elsinoe fawcettii]
MRLAAYAGTSAALAAGALIKAFSQRPNYYSATVYLAQSNACVLILTNLALVCTVSFIYGLQRLLYGRLRPIEIEQLSEKAWYAVLDTLLAMPSLRDDVGGWLLVIFVLLLAGKVWGWIAEGRVDLLEQQPPQNPRLFHARLAASLLVSVAFSSFMTKYCTQSVLDNPRPGMMVIFTFEFAILTIFSLFTLSRYFLALFEIYITQQQTRQKVEERKAEIREERTRALRDSGDETGSIVEPTDDDVDENEVDVPGWEEKRRWLFGLELATDFIKIVVYTVFFTISLTFIGLPMHIMRDVYITIANFSKRIQDYSNYRRATQDMNSRYPDATAEELAQDNTCIVCREAMIPWDDSVPAQAEGAQRRRNMNEGLRAKKLPCNHILHLRCLKAWLERQQACPTCRRPVIPRAVPQTRDARGNLRPVADVLAEAQRAQGQAGQPGQAGAVGAVAPNAQQAQQQARRNRMRWLNMGPVRIGFYNGPAGDVQEALRRQDQGVTSTTRPVTQARLARRTAHLSNQDHIRSVEQRLLEQAHNMQVEAAQLVHVRALEAELARLRSLYIEPGSSAQAASTGATLEPTREGAASVPIIPHVQAVQPYQTAPGSTTFGPGNEGYPEGLVLPEGWTMVPLQAANINVPHGVQQPAQPFIPFPAAFQPAPGPQQATVDQSTSHPRVTMSSTTMRSSVGAGSQQTPATHNPGDHSPANAPPSATRYSTPQAGTPPTTEVATSAQTVDEPSLIQRQRSGDPVAPSSQARASAQATSSNAPAASNQPSWGASTPSWSFNAADGLAPENTQSKEHEDLSAANGTANGSVSRSSVEATQSDEGKGKGKAAEVEDVPDSGV